ncbi:MAG: O-antigen ligase family protein [Cyanobacteria bacterium SZAS-4]|nr:O-antigen ligase family protein [Cyanobacteria bacterium SZAS-4]
MQAEPTMNENSKLHSWKNRLQQLQCWLVIAYAASLSLPITVPWIILTVGIIVAVVQLLINVKLKSFKFEMPPLTVPIACLTVVYFVSGLFNGEPNAGLAGGLKEALASVGVMRTFLVYFWAYFAIHDSKELKAKIVPSLLVLGALGGIAAMIEHQFQLHISSFKYLQGTGFLSGPMAFAGVMQMLSLLSISLWLTGAYDQLAGRFKEKLIFIPIAIGNILGLLFAFERSAWFGFGVGAMLVAGFVSRKLLMRVVALGLVVCVVGWFALPAVQARMGGILRGEQEESSRQRMEVWMSAINQYKSSTVDTLYKSEIIGVGPRKFSPVKIQGPNKQELDHAHSNYLQSLTTTGLIGFVVYMWLCLASLKLAWQNVKKARVDDVLDKSIGLGILGGTLSLMLAGIFEYNFGTGNVRLAQWFLLAMLTAQQSWSRFVRAK